MSKYKQVGSANQLVGTAGTASQVVPVQKVLLQFTCWSSWCWSSWREFGPKVKPVEKIEKLVDYYTKVFECSFDLYQKGLLQFHTQYINQDWDLKK